MNNFKYIKAHICMFASCLMWGLMAPIGKEAMLHGISGLDMVAFRVVGGAVLFWLTSLFTKREEVPSHDLMMLFFAALLGLVFNQCCLDRKSTRLNSSHQIISYAVFCLKK